MPISKVASPVKGWLPFYNQVVAEFVPFDRRLVMEVGYGTNGQG